MLGFFALTYTWTTSAPARDPVLVTRSFTEIVEFVVDTFRSDKLKVV